MKLFGTIMYLKNRYLTLQFSRCGKNVVCEDCFDTMLMCNAIEAGKELMPHRNPADDVTGSSSLQQLEHLLGDLQEPIPTTPIQKLCRNCSLVLPEQQVVVNDSPESQEYESPSRATIRRGKRKIR